jgi:hypothetical protein
MRITKIRRASEYFPWKFPDSGIAMATLAVGMLVRIKWSLTWPCLSGQQGRIVARITEQQRRYLPAGHSGEWEVAPDCWGGSASPDGEGYFFPASEQLEPILPEGMQQVRWEDCQWQPETTRAET